MTRFNASKELNKQRRIITALIMISCLLALTAFSCGNTAPTSPKGQLITETYIVQPGDTLWDIAAVYMTKNTYAPREIREFYSGIQELNWELFQNRKPGTILPGDRLRINYWVKGDAEK